MGALQVYLKGQYLKEQLALSTELMTEIEEIDPYGRTLTTQSGVKLQTIQEVSEQHNMFFPLDLGARGSCSIGGNASTNAGGNKGDPIWND